MLVLECFSRFQYLLLNRILLSKQDRLQTDIFDSVNQQSPNDGDMSDDEDADSVSP